jgi:NO-binding membrane sensor protein with MHYT domain
MGHLPWRKIGSALIMSAAICVMLHTGMAAATQALRGSGCKKEFWRARTQDSEMGSLFE